ncbi:polysaccharide deacetylase family protein [Aurantiacibacter aquimixticola]|uniref:Chitooligosaccharide deacetylase n=1 Tax=Aurantiacibacter aquimixticola TaxID=1958945 RepID=A0A419RTL9_9SPHN|nr:polysaccharide deacetylase family protein [Aurantiacibacter aquimixticola]RJY09094.1 polysaccharide deacetylase [Aurantiacibacter aquimixticola]
MRKRTWWLAGLLAVAVLAVGTHMMSKSRCFQLVGDVVCRVETDRRIVALSFDDGPTPEGTDAVLATLEEYGVTATFFLIGNRLERFPGQAERLTAAGHEIGNHSYSHQRNLFRSRDFYRSEVRDTDALLREAGIVTDLFRPPFGKRLIGLPLEVDNAGYRTIMWDVEERPEDFDDPEEFAADIVSRVEPGSIILMHPMYRHNDVARAALPLVLQGLAARGYEIVTVGELLAHGESAASQ